MTPTLLYQLEKLSRAEKIEVLDYLVSKLEFTDIPRPLRESIEKKFARPMGVVGARTCPHCGGAL